MRPGDIPDKEIPHAAAEDVVRQYAGWVTHIAKKYTGLTEQTGAFDDEDLFQVGSMALLEAQKSYDPKHGKSFLSWSYAPIRNAISNMFRHLPPQPMLSLDSPVTDEAEVRLLDTIADPDAIPMDEPLCEEESRQETAEAVHSAINRMKSEKQREVIRRIYLDGQGRDEIAVRMGIRKTALYALDQAGRSTLRRDYLLKEYVKTTPFFHVGAERYQTTWTSAVEEAVLWREKHCK